ncbi:hypothetical protein VTJ04DRAFT_458 [Mycothermus thermophilus]|uniref:uncharacterized protein n=1 Tax=Humicola insolens TaxID=85995 RepID=UPI0037440CA5
MYRPQVFINQTPSRLPKPTHHQPPWHRYSPKIPPAHAYSAPVQSPCVSTRINQTKQKSEKQMSLCACVCVCAANALCKICLAAKCCQMIARKENG